MVWSVDDSGFNPPSGDNTVMSLFADGDLNLLKGGAGVVLTSPDGSTTKRVYLDNSGTLQTEAV
jgi:hypothetical protein